MRETEAGTGSPIPFLVLELATGQSLAERLRRGPLSVTDTVAVARKIADAVEHAHEHGIIQRDLKPANVVVDDELGVKVFDFGLAKALLTEAPDATLSDSSTLPADTVARTLLGTAAYMSPEQARGKEVDARADVWGQGPPTHDAACAKRKACDGSGSFDAKVCPAIPTGMNGWQRSGWRRPRATAPR